jgi:uncharacterized protein YndB with AHSA1/START domain
MDASVTKQGERYVLALERSLSHSAEKVWRVLTERELLKQWFPCDVEGEWKVGAALRFTFLHGEGEGLSEEDLKGEVLVVEPPHLLEFRWNQNLIRCELVADGEGCKLIFSETLNDSSWGARNAAGWELCLESMETILQAGTLVKFGWEVWRRKFERYVKKFEPQFGPQQGPPESHPAAGAES